VATGGSVVYNARAMEHLKKNGILLFLDVSLPVLKQRIRDMESRGVVLAPGQDLAELYAERMPLYEQHGDIRIPCDGKGHEEVIRQILREFAVWRIP
jgi:shikimate kinase